VPWVSFGVYKKWVGEFLAKAMPGCWVKKTQTDPDNIANHNSKDTG